MIISASRRTDIPAFYAEWFMNRVRAGYCLVPNPFNREQVAHVSLAPADVEAIVFWTRNPRPLLPYLQELDDRGLRYYFQYTLLANPRPIDPKAPPPEAALRTFQTLAQHVGPERVIWRYDPIVLSNVTTVDFHRETYGRIAAALDGCTRRSVISLLDVYRKAEKRLRDMSQEGVELAAGETIAGLVAALIPDLAALAAGHGMEIVSCAEEIDLTPYGVRAGKCVDDAYLRRVFGIEVSDKKDPSQREACGCVISKDIGMYDSCLFGCRYCYATSSFERAQANHAAHRPGSPSLLS